ncbi:hypothetical protein [Halopseudomonas aestusnigri]|jgi:hypothetical protein|uniref:hypothetical protein n=1 Tax=Halopseudomonas aestusnigri TaxID=857252 RepID=UPI001357921B|nr:hypothetical protein [Halopseudomonas aestusnigri]
MMLRARLSSPGSTACGALADSILYRTNNIGLFPGLDNRQIDVPTGNGQWAMGNAQN